VIVIPRSLLLIHEVRRGGTIMHFTDPLVIHARVEKNAFGGRRLAGVNVSGLMPMFR
jgi:hypothetical protein